MALPVWVHYDFLPSDVSFYHVNRQFGFLDEVGKNRQQNKVGKSWQQIWDDDHNKPIRDLGRTPTTLRGGDALWLLKPAQEANTTLTTYTVTGNESSLDEICATINKKYARGTEETLAGGPVSPPKIYLMFENSPFRARHEQYRYTGPNGPDDTLRFKKLEPGSELHYFVKKKPVVVVVVPPAQTPPPGPPLPGPPPPMTTLTLAPPTVTLKLGTQRTLVPLVLAADKFRESKVDFDIELSTDVALTRIHIFRTRPSWQLLFSKDFTSGPLVTQGKHTWSWDGFSSGASAMAGGLRDGVLDTSTLRGRLVVSVLVRPLGGGAAVIDTLVLDNKPALADYTEVEIDLIAKTILASFYVRCDELSFWDVAKLSGALSVAGALLGPMLGPVVTLFSSLGTPAVLARSRLSSADFWDASVCVQRGLQWFWSRNGTSAVFPVGARTFNPVVRVDNVDYPMTTTGVLNTSGHAAVPFRLIAPLFHNQRSTNLGAVVNGLPVIMVYEREKQNSEDTGAHEAGHSVLRDMVGKDWSIRHKGSTSLLQETLPGQPTYPTTGEIDLMQYWTPFYDSAGKPYRPGDWYDRTIATEGDCKGLISITQVEFDEA